MKTDMAWSSVKLPWDLSPRSMFSGLVRVIREDRAAANMTAALMVLQLAVIGWDQPSSIGWENDGVAPRDFLRGVYENLRFGHGHRYPLFHNLILLAVCLPVLLLFGAAGQLSSSSIQQRVTSVACMTCVSLLIKLVHVAVGGGLMLLTARIARRLFGVVAGRAALLCAMTSVTLSYYARTSNLDGPYMLWTVLAIDRLLSVIERGVERDYVLLGLFVAASVATKDQAYAGYVLTLPVFLLLVPLWSPSSLAAGSKHLRYLGTATLAGAAGYLVLAGVIFNPTGLLARIALLTGPNSQEWRSYARSGLGLSQNLLDLFSAQTAFFWHPVIVALCWCGLVFGGLQRTPHGLTVSARRLVPLVAAFSSLLAFTLPVGRCEHRFVLPLGVWLSVYGGASLAWLFAQRARAWPILALVACALGLSAFQSLSLALTQLGDARNEVERLLQSLPAGSVVETYGYNVYQPRFGAANSRRYRVERVGKEPTDKRAKIAGVDEVQARFADVAGRRPDLVLVNEGFAERFLPRSFGPGEAPSVQWLTSQSDTDAVAYFRAALAGVMPGYSLKLSAAPRLPRWASRLGAQPISIHDRTTAERVLVFARNPVSSLAALPARGLERAGADMY